MNRARSVRFRLLLIAILPMFVILPAIVGGLIYQWDLRFDRLLASKVGGDLKVAGQYMNQLLVNDRATPYPGTSLRLHFEAPVSQK